MARSVLLEWLPLEIDTIAVPSTGGTLGMTVCPGRKAPGLRSGGWSRDLMSDLDAVAAAGAAVLVTLMEGWELETYGVPPDLLATEVRARGIDWYHLPITDMGVPDPEFERQWVRVSDALHGRLGKGETIVIHCLAGLGRTGVVAARLLVEAGLEPAAAIATVRRARPGTIQTPDQERHVYAFAVDVSGRGEA